jgi:hypothetical protein
MGILATFFFLILILTIGFVYNNWSLSFLIFVMTSIFATLLAQSSVEEIIQQWDKRRCDIEIMMTAQLFKPKDDPRTGGEFASENFQFCVKKTFREIITLALTPVFMMLNQQLDVTESINEVLNRLRVMMANLMDGFLKILEPFFLRFRTTGNQFAVNQMKLLSAMGRAFGITQAALYIGMSLVITIENFVQFVIRVVMIIMYIILGLMVLIWFLILPVFIVIIITCQAIGNSPFGYLSKDVCGELCFDPRTRIKLKDGTVKPIGQCELHDMFEDGTVIEGILHVDGTKEQMYSLDGIRVSGAHLVWSTYTDEWIPVQEHPDALPSFQRCPTLVCLRTSTRNIPLEGLTSKWFFRDWEELPIHLPRTDTIWDFLVSEILNETANTGPVPTEIPLLKPSCQVMYKTGEMRSISEVRIGDSIYCSQGFTRVTGLYKGHAEFSNEFTDGLWFQELGETSWRHPSLATSSGTPEIGFHLTTESGCFWIQTKSISGFVRDFTEVGVDQLPLTYRYTRELLKKSFSREESCVSVSLSQASLSCSQPIF